MGERELIERAKKGDSQAFAILFKENYPCLVSYLIKVTMKPDIAEDIAQETMMKCIEKIRLYNGKSKFSSWLITIATNHYIDSYRKKKREANWISEEQSLRKMQWQFESQNEEWTDVMSSLGRLPDQVRIPIVLKHYYGYSYEEIASMLELAIGTVKSRIHNGILTLRKELNADEKE
ncbi:RNA polymerase sigma factor SigY [Litchfieldia salsa]|uniref:RNA polymerase, sigma subunit, SigY n=1 Tax=Litchfieldia salsa TaxID=930152 RepID=A0A1H0UZA9_9BACI|nr:RNA polymerase sigma factor SigY [Litchfieldia salsa]SDP71268.1 RNA polymerase, sigma subunit, SigY [Litchfieldia salsa]